MSGRGSKRRGRPPKTPTMDRQNNSKFQYHLMKKPKYLLNRGSDSQVSTPTASRASSPHGSDSSRPSVAARPSTSRMSVNAGSSRKSGRASAATPQAKGRGKASQSATPYSKKEYMYGSDFGESSDEADADDDMLLSQSESESLIGDQESESDFSLSSFSSGIQKRTRAPSPEPLWLQQRDIPPLELPTTSDDLLLPVEHTLRTAAVYEIMRRFKYMMRLTPFRLEDLCAALASDDQSALLIEVHVALLKAILREEDAQNTHFGPLDQKDSVNISLYLIDQFTWPEILRSYIESDTTFDRSVLNILTNTEYPYTSADNRLTVLQFLTDQFLVTTSVREDIVKEGPIHYDDHCRICHRLGDLLCCETCPAVFHLECVDPPMVDVPTEDWQCSICKAHQISGVYDCMSTQEKQGMLCRQDHLGYDRHGRKYWFISRRVFVENEEGTQIWYYSTVDQFEQLLSRLDQDDMELSLCRELADLKEEIVRQMEITETLTNDNKGSKRSYLEIVNAKIREDLKKAVEGEPMQTADEDAQAPSEESNVTIDESKMDVDCDSDSSKHATRTKTGTLPQRTPSKTVTGATKETEPKLLQTNSNHLMFRLGMENTYKAYINQYTTSPIALNKPQRNEERDKKRHLSHKFSLTTASEFKWSGSVLTGSHASLITALRSTLINLEQNVSTTYMHPNWPAIRKQWMTAVSSSSKPIEFAKILSILMTCFKSPIFANVWHEQLGHIKLHRITAAEREEKKKLEKREKREKDDEEERNRLSVNFVKYSLGLKHQVWKQKGEEYRIHGQWGWIWMSYGRRELKRQPTSDSIRVHKVMVPIQQSGISKIICIRPSTFEYFKESREKSANESTVTVPLAFQNVELVDTISSFEKIDVSKALAAPGRLLYPKQAKKSKLDDLLAHRVALRDAEEAKLKEIKTEDKSDAVAEPTKPAVVTAPKIYSQTSIEKQLSKIISSRAQLVALQKIPNIDMDLIHSLAKSIQAARQQFGQLNRFAKHYKCYNKECNTTNTNVFSLPQASIVSCYSPVCLQKTRVKRELLTLLRKAHTAGNGCKETVTAIMAVVNKKPSILEQKLNESKVVVDPKSDDPLKMQKDFKEAVTVSFAYSQEDITECISNDDQSLEPVKKEEPIKTEILPDCEPMVFDDDHQVEVEVGGEQKDDSYEIKLDGEMSPESKRQRLNDSVNEDVTSTIEIHSDEGEDVVETRSTRKSLRNVRSKTQVTTTTTTTTSRTTTEFDDGSVEEESNSSIKTRSRENQSDSKKNVTSYNTSSTVSQKKYVSHPNRRFAATSTKAVKKEETHQIVKEYGPNGGERVYTISTSAGRLYLKKTLVDTSSSKSSTVSKIGVSRFPVIQSYLTRKGSRSLMVLPRHELIKMSRCGGKYSLAGYHHLSKNNSSAWPYPSSRPQFKTSWFFRTMNLRTLSAVALQIRIVWCCLRWDDMATKPPTNDGKHQVTTETEIMSLEILKYRHCGRFSEKTQYLRRKVVIPLELPKTIREFTSIRSGLRKRKRAESPQKTDPQVSEEWVDEDKLELWEIKQFGEKQERANIASQPITTRTTTGKLPVVRTGNAASTDSASSGSNSTSRVIVNSKATPEEIKEKMEQQLRIQRAAHHQKRALEQKVSAPLSHPSKMEVQENESVEDLGKPQFIGQRKIIVKNADGTTKIIQQNIPAPSPKVMSTNSSATTSDSPSTSSSGGPGQKVQIIRGPDGKVSVRGLNAGQQLIQMPDGKLHVLTSNQSGGQNKTPVRQAAAGSASPKTPTVVKTPTTITQTPGQKQVIVRQQIVKGTPTLLNKGVAKTPQAVRQVIQQGTSNQVKVQQVSSSSPGGQKIITAKSQILNNQKIVQSGSTNLQQLLTQGGQNAQKVVVNQSTGNRVIIQQSTAPKTQQQQVVAQQQQIVQAKSQQQQQQMVVSPTQKITQQYVNTTNKQQEVLLNGQRIILAPGQRIITSQQQQPQTQIVQQQVVHQQPQQQQIVIQQQPPQQQLVVQAQPQQQQILVQQQQPIQQQVIVNNSNLAQQLAQGKLQVTNINGQQVIIKPLGNNQAQIVAHIKTQNDGQAHIVQSSTTRTDQLPDSTTEVQQQIQEQQNVQQQVQQQQQQQVILQSTSPQQQQQANIEQSLLQGQPPGTVIKCVTAQVIQTQQGPRIVLQGLAGNDFTPHQLSLVQQQVKQQLLKAQETSGKTGVLGPTKIYLAVQPAVAPAGALAQPPPLAPVQSPQQSQQIVSTPATATSVVAAAASPATSSSSPSIIAAAIPTTPVPTNVIKVVSNGATSSSVSTPSTMPSTPTPTQKIVSVAPSAGDVKNQLVQKVLANKQIKDQKIIQRLKTSEPMLTTSEDESVTPELNASVAPTDNSFIVTPDYIQQTIKNALKQENLNPEIEEKLLNLQRYQEKQMKTDDIQHKPHPSPLATARNTLVHQNSPSAGMPSPAKPPGSAAKRRPAAARHLDDDDWVLDTPRRKAPGAGTVAALGQQRPVGATTTATPLKKSGASSTETSPAGSATPVANKRSIAALKRESDKKKAALQAQIRLNRHKEQLKKDILKKRALLEKELQMSIQRELATELKGTTQASSTAVTTTTPPTIKPKAAKALASAAKMLTTGHAKSVATIAPSASEAAPIVPQPNQPNAGSVANSAEDNGTVSQSPDTPDTSMTETEPIKAPPKDALTPANPGKRRPVPTHKATIKTNKPDSTPSKGGRSRKGNRMSAAHGLSKKKEKLYCLCRTPYDDSKFYVGCDLCNNWFHGDCVGISESESKTMSEFVCGECKHARDTQELYCLCRKPYDESQFYICCDKCQDWFHGRCVGILQSEADNIDEYICPKCQQNSSVNLANMKSLSQLEHDNLKKLIKQIQSHKSSWPFMEPVDPDEAPDYYRVIKDPMDLQKIEKKIADQLYTKLSEFIGDMTKIFDNCRFYNTKESPFYRCAESLEGYFVQKIKHFRENLASNEQPQHTAP